MSYDLIAFRLPPGTDPQAGYQQTLRQQDADTTDIAAWKSRVLPVEAKQHMRALADVLKSAWPAFLEIEPVQPMPQIELDDDTADVQLSIEEHFVDISVPYFRNDPSAAMNCLRACLDVLHAHGFTVFDHQLGRVLAPEEFQLAAASYRSVDANRPAILASAAKKPWWKLW